MERGKEREGGSGEAEKRGSKDREECRARGTGGGMGREEKRGR